MSKTTLLALSVFSAVIFAGCNTTTQEAPVDIEVVESDAEQMMEESSSDAMMEKEGMMTIEMSNFEYSVEEIMVEPGETLELKLVNTGGDHDFDIDELNIDTEIIAEGEEMTVTVEIPADATSGTSYAYYCSVGNHRAQGMEGMIVVK